MKNLAPPNSKESEMMVLGCVLANPQAINIVTDSLQESDFYYSEHQLIFSVIKSYFSQSKVLDLHILSEELKRQGNIKSIGGTQYLVALAQYAGVAAHLEAYIKMVKDKATLRLLIEASRLTQAEAADEPEDAISAVDIAQQRLFAISSQTKRSYGYLLAQILSGEQSESNLSFLQELQKRQELFQLKAPSDLAITGIPTHFPDIDKILNGLGKSNLIILAARPAMGKTSLALNIAENVCFKSNLPVGVFSLEMSADQLAHRIVSSQAEVDSQRIKTGDISSFHFQKIVEAVENIKNYPFIIDDQAGISISQLRSKARAMKQTHDIQLLVIDYLQLITGSGSVRSQENRQNEISEISRMLKNLARELNIPILCLSQLSRKVEERQDKKPVMSDLRESGAIEQDADIVMFIYREEYYKDGEKPGLAQIIVAKNRHGPTDTVSLSFLSNLTKFLPLKQKESSHEDF